MEPLAVVLLTLNEASQIPDFVASLPVGIPIVVVDCGSTDGTADLAAELGCKTLCRGWTGFADQRNFALESLALEFEWVLFIDADERYPAEFFYWLKEFMSLDSDVDVVYVSQRLVFGKKVLKYAPGYPIYHPRLVRARTVNFISNNSNHGETVKIGLGVSYVDTPYLHYFLEKGLQAWLKKHLALAFAEVAEGPVRNGGIISHRERVSQLIGIGPARALLRFLYHYVFCRGFLDGREGFLYSAMYSWYEVTKWLSSERMAGVIRNSDAVSR